MDNTFTSTFKTITNSDFAKLGRFIHSQFGIKMPEAKKTMLQSRLQKRLRTLGLGSFKEYCGLILESDAADNEIIHMMDVVTTNKTDFFREPAHFDYLADKVLPELLAKQNAPKSLLAWSAGCSTGEEPYTLGMVLSEYAQNHEKFNFKILATDLSTQVLETAHMAIYKEDKVQPVPTAFKKKYLLKSKDPSQQKVRIVPELRSTVKFRRLNFMDNDYQFDEKVDFIFFRNVIIYFDRPTQEKIINKMTPILKPGGYLFMGHSETLFGLNVGVQQVAPTIYYKPH